MHPNVKKNLSIFRATYQKPSRIYRFLCEEWKTHPLFLNRTLSYVNKHRDRKIKPRPTKINDIARNLMLKSEGTPSKSTVKTRWQSTIPTEGRVCCLFNWICNDPDKTCQKTRSFGFICPWCEIDCRHLDTLMMHLKCCHPRFNFNLVEEDGYSVIEMSLNISYDGSYCGFKYPGHDLKRDFRFTPKTPQRRSDHTQIIFIKSKRRLSSHYIHRYSPNDQYFATIDEGDEVDVDVCSGRLYYHTSTCLPIKPNEGDIDSEADMDPEWLKERTQLMIDEFTDVNEGEKEILKLWNLHIMSNYKYKNDSMIRIACLDFVEREGNTILSKNLTRNFVLHLANLYDFGLLSSGDVLECYRKFRRMKSPPQNSPTRAASKVKLDRNSNEHCQLSPPAKRALLNSYCNQ
jgi:hypothetical protein